MREGEKKKMKKEIHKKGSREEVEMRERKASSDRQLARGRANICENQSKCSQPPFVHGGGDS